MTVSTEVDHNEYTGNGVTTSFPYTFRIFKKSDLVVQVSDLNGNVTKLVLDAGYTVTGRELIVAVQWFFRRRLLLAGESR